MSAKSKNQPTDPELWEKSKATAKKRYEIWPSAYAIGHALKLYKDEGGGWKKAKTAGDTTTIDPAYVKGLRKWVKATFVPKARYATLDDLIAHLKNLRDKQLNLLWEHLFYTKGLLPRDEGYESIIEDLRVKVRDEIKDARAILDDDLERLEHTRDALQKHDWNILEFYQRINFNDPFDAALKAYEDQVNESIAKVEGILSGKLLRSITAFLGKYAGGVPFESNEILLEYNIGNVKLVFDGAPNPYLINRPDPANPRDLHDYIPYFKKAKALLDNKGFGFLWYGPIFVGCPKCGGSNHLGEKFGVGAHYVIQNDRVVVFLKPKPFMVELLLHELGHRYYYKFMDAADRAGFDRYFREVAAVSEYGGTITSEDFAEVFAHFILGRDMTRDQIERFKAFLAKKDRKRVARGKAKKDVGHGGLDEWFSGHGGAKGKGEEATWGDWVAISPVKKTLESGKKVEPGDIVGPCGVSKEPDWADFTSDGKDPLKCMPRQKAYDMDKAERAGLAKAKQKAEKMDSNRGKSPTHTTTFEKTSAARVANRYFQAALIGDPKQLLEAYESRLGYYENREASIAQTIQNYIDGHIEKRESELDNAYSRLNFDLKSGAPNAWVDLTRVWEERHGGSSLRTEALMLARSYQTGFEQLREFAQPLFWAILQQLSLPANLTKKVQAASKYWTKSRLNSPRADKRPWVSGFRYIEYPASFLTNMGVWREHLALARECLAKGVPHGEGTKSKVQAGPFTLVNTGSFPDEVMENVKQAVLKAAKAMTSIGLGKVCYGDILVSKQIKARSNVLAFYILASDEMFVRADAKATHDIVQTICHELAHRLENKFSVSPRDINNLYNTIAHYDGVQAGAVSGWPEVGRRIKYKKLDLVVVKVDKINNKITFEQPPAPGLIKRARYSAPIEWWVENIDVGAKIERSPDFNGFITPYAKKGGPGENFAEMVAYYALGELPAALVALLKPVLATA